MHTASIGYAPRIAKKITTTGFGGVLWDNMIHYFVDDESNRTQLTAKIVNLCNNGICEGIHGDLSPYIQSDNDVVVSARLLY